MMKKILNILTFRPKWQMVLSGFVLIVLLGLIDYRTGDFSLTVFYILPVFIGGWFVNRRTGLIFSLCSGVAIVIARKLPEIQTIHTNTNSIVIWNTTMEVCFLILMNYMFCLIKRELEIEKMLARTDHLTGALNRRSYLELTEYEIKQSRRHHRPLTITYIDLDNFKEVNDQLGHHSGDLLLTTVVKILQENIRNTDLVARIGGDEFSLLFPETDALAANELLIKLQSRLLGAMQVNGWSVTFSIGAVTYLTPPVSVESMLKEADARMYEVKQAGKNMVSHATIETPLSGKQGK